MGKQMKKIEENVQNVNAALNEHLKAAHLSKKDEAYLRGTPSRMEVANYVTSIIEQHYIPSVQKGFQLGIMVMQAILIKKGICTGEEIQEFTKSFIEEQKARVKAAEDSQEKQQQDQQPESTEQIEEQKVE